MVLNRLLPECPVAGNPVKFVQREEPVAVQRDELDGGQDEVELLLGQVVSKTQPCPSWLQSTITLKKCDITVTLVQFCQTKDDIYYNHPTV